MFLVIVAELLVIYDVCTLWTVLTEVRVFVFLLILYNMINLFLGNDHASRLG